MVNRKVFAAIHHGLCNLAHLPIAYSLLTIQAEAVYSRKQQIDDKKIKN